MHEGGVFLIHTYSWYNYEESDYAIFTAEDALIYIKTIVCHPNTTSDWHGSTFR